MDFHCSAMRMMDTQAVNKSRAEVLHGLFFFFFQRRAVIFFFFFLAKIQALLFTVRIFNRP